MNDGRLMAAATGGTKASGFRNGLIGTDSACRSAPPHLIGIRYAAALAPGVRVGANPLRATSGCSTAPQTIPTAEAAPRPDAQASAPLPTRPTWTGLVGTAARICHEGPVPAPASQSAATWTFDRPPPPSFTITLQVRPKRLLCALPKQRQASTLPRFLSRTQPSMLPGGLGPTQSTLWLAITN